MNRRNFLKQIGTVIAGAAVAKATESAIADNEQHVSINGEDRVYEKAVIPAWRGNGTVLPMPADKFGGFIVPTEYATEIEKYLKG